MKWIRGVKKPKRKRGESSTNIVDYLTGTFFVVLFIMILYGVVEGFLIYM